MKKPFFVNNLLESVKNSLNGGNISKEHRDYLLIKELYHCTPSQLWEQEERVLEFHFNVMMMELKNRDMETKKEQQRAQVKSILSKK